MKKVLKNEQRLSMNIESFYSRTSFPTDLLPSTWKGTEARELFWNIHQLISIPAIRYFESLFEHAPDSTAEPQRDKAINPFDKVYV